jgi:CubicO group peptidase (beta-lactamase class C family)
MPLLPQRIRRVDRTVRLSIVAVATLASVLVLAAMSAAQVAGAGTDPLPRATPESVGLSSAGLRQATALLDRLVAEGKIAGGVAAVARKGKLVYLEARGVQDLASRAPMTDRSMFRIYSMAKTVTAVAALMLHAEGRFALTDPVSKFLPEFSKARVFAAADGSITGPTRAPTSTMTVEDLLLHTSGLSHRTSELYQRERVRSRSVPLTQLVSNMAATPLMEDPGTRFRYSEGTSIVGRLIELWSGKTLDAFLQDRIFGPLDMPDTKFWVSPAQRPRFTTVYGPKPGGGLVPVDMEAIPFTERPALLEGAVGLVSTVPDFMRFAQMLLGKGVLDSVRLLNDAVVTSATANGLRPDILAGRTDGTGWGLANVSVVLDPSKQRYPANRGEYGWDGTAGTIFWVDPSLEMVTILMTQSSPANPDGLRQQFKTLVHGALLN